MRAKLRTFSGVEPTAGRRARRTLAAVFCTAIGVVLPVATSGQQPRTGAPRWEHVASASVASRHFGADHRHAARNNSRARHDGPNHGAHY